MKQPDSSQESFERYEGINGIGCSWLASTVNCNEGSLPKPYAALVTALETRSEPGLRLKFVQTPILDEEGNYTASIKWVHKIPVNLKNPQ